MRGTDVMSRVRIGCAFVTAEIAMNLIGALLGATLGKLIGSVAGYLGFAALVGVGVYMIYETIREEREPLDLSRGWGLFIGALSISLDSLGIGFSILFIGVPLGIALAFIAVASVIATLGGLTLGRFLGQRAEGAAARWAGAILIATGVGFAVAKFYNV